MKEVSKLIAFDGTKLLLLKKKTSATKFSLLGGGVKKKESPKEAVIRESKEEGDIDIDKKKLVKIKSIVHDSSSEGTHMIHYFIIDNVSHYQLLEPHKFDTLEWVDYKYGLSKLKGIHRKVIEKYIHKILKK